VNKSEKEERAGGEGHKREKEGKGRER